MDQGQLYDAADQQLQQANRDAQERGAAFLRWALAQPGANVDDCHAACWLAGIDWSDVGQH